MVLAMGCLMVGAATGLIGGLLVVVCHSPSQAHTLDFSGWWVIAILCFLVRTSCRKFQIGYLMAMLVMGVVESAVATTYVVWCEDPAACSVSRPVEYTS